MKKILLDTNTYSAHVQGNTETSAILRDSSIVVYMPVIVVAELRVGFKSGNRELENEIILKAFLKKSTILEVNLETTDQYAKIIKSLRLKGRPIPTNDVWIAALALQHQVPLLTFDAHFQHVDDLRIIQTFADFQRI